MISLQKQCFLSFLFSTNFYTADYFSTTEPANNRIKSLRFVPKQQTVPILGSFIRMKRFLFLFCCWFCCFSSKAEEDRTSTRSLLLEKVHESWHMPIWKAQVDEEKKSEKIQEKPQTLQQRTQHVILPKFVISNLPLSQALKVLTEIVRVYDLDNKENINFVLIDPQHKAPNVDLDLQSISLEKAIHFLKEQTNLEVVFEGNTVIFKNKAYENEKLETRIFPIARGNVLQALNYSRNPKDERSDEALLKDFFLKLGIPFTDENFGFAYDGQNIIVTHHPQYLNKISEIVALYHQDKQIAIEAKFLEIQQGVLEELGLKWDLGGRNQVKASVKDNLRPLSHLQNIQINANGTTPTFPNALNFGTNIGNFLDANVFLNHYQMNAFLRAIEQRTDTDLMSAPKVTVLSGRKAEITVAQELRYPESYRDGRAEVGQAGTGSTSAGTALIAGVPEKFVTRNIGVEMSVTPIAGEGNTIHLHLKPSVTEFEGFVEYGGKNVVTYGSNTSAYGSGYYQPIFSTRKIETEVSLHSGSTLVMGGLTREEVEETHDKIPFFSQIPLLGKLFTSKGQTSQKKNLLIFVTANLVDENGKCFTNSEVPILQKL